MFCDLYQFHCYIMDAFVKNLHDRSAFYFFYFLYFCCLLYLHPQELEVDLFSAVKQTMLELMEHRREIILGKLTQVCALLYFVFTIFKRNLFYL